MKPPVSIRINLILERVADPVLYDHMRQFKARARAEQLRAVAHDGVLLRRGLLNSGLVQVAGQHEAAHEPLGMEEQTERRTHNDLGDATRVAFSDWEEEDETR